MFLYEMPCPALAPRHSSGGYKEHGGWGRDWDIVNADCYGLSLSLLTVELQMSMLFLMMLMIRQCCNETLCSRFERIVMNVSIVEFKIYLSMVKKNGPIVARQCVW